MAPAWSLVAWAVWLSDNVYIYIWQQRLLKLRSMWSLLVWVGKGVRLGSESLLHAVLPCEGFAHQGSTITHALAGMGGGAAFSAGSSYSNLMTEGLDWNK